MNKDLSFLSGSPGWCGAQSTMVDQVTARGLFELTLNMALGLNFIMATKKPIKPIIFLKLSLYIHFIFYKTQKTFCGHH